MAGCAPCASPPGPTTRCAPRSSSPRPATGPTKGEAIAQAQWIPLKFLENILSDLRHAGLVRSQRGADGGYWLGRPGGRDHRRRRHPRRRGPAGLGARRPARGRRLRGRRRAAAAGLDRRARQPARRRRARHAGRRRRGPPARARGQAGRGSRGVGDALAPEIAATDYHTAGEPFRIVTAGVPAIAGRDGARAPRARGRVGGRSTRVRRLLCHEPRGHADMYGCFLVAARRRRRRPRRAVLAQGRLLDRVRARDDRARRVGGRVRARGRARATARST